MYGMEEVVATVASGAGMVIGVGLDILFLVVSLTLVKRRRPDVSRLFVSSAVLGLAVGVVMPLLHFLVAHLGYELMDMVSIGVAFSVLSFVGGNLGGVAFLLIIVGVVKMSKPAA